MYSTVGILRLQAGEDVKNPPATKRRGIGFTAKI
jgi:hypothetical protein